MDYSMLLGISVATEDELEKDMIQEQIHDIKPYRIWRSVILQE